MPSILHGRSLILASKTGFPISNLASETSSISVCWIWIIHQPQKKKAESHGSRFQISFWKIASIIPRLSFAWTHTYMFSPVHSTPTHTRTCRQIFTYTKLTLKEIEKACLGDINTVKCIQNSPKVSIKNDRGKCYH